MKLFLSCTLTIVLLLGFCGVATGATTSLDDLSWWAQSGATPAPVKDSSRSGYWWWPTTPASNANDSELWGNRGIVYSMYSPAPPAPPEVAPRRVDPPPAPEPPTVVRSVPVFNHVLFDFDKSTIKSAGQTEIANVADELKKHSGDDITVEGHTDSVNRSGDPDYNTKLGQRRADAVVKVLVENGISAGRVTAVSKGEKEPAVSNDTAENRAKNRRVVFLYKIND